MKNVRTVFNQFAYLGLGLLIMAGALANVNLKSFPNEHFQVKVGQYGLYFFKDNPDHQIFEISPLDDYYYEGQTKDHLLTGNTVRESKETTDNIFNIVQTLIFHHRKIKWTSEGRSNTKIAYTVESQGNILNIQRKVLSADFTPEAIGQSLVICPSCLIVDDKNRIYFQEDYITPEKLNLAKNLNLTPVVTANVVLPSDINSISVYDQNFNLLFVLTVNPGENVTYDEQWHVLEVKIPINDLSATVQKITIN